MLQGFSPMLEKRAHLFVPPSFFSGFLDLMNRQPRVNVGAIR